jgi:hypothetical protein
MIVGRWEALKVVFYCVDKDFRFLIKKEPSTTFKKFTNNYEQRTVIKNISV